MFTPHPTASFAAATTLISYLKVNYLRFLYCQVFYLYLSVVGIIFLVYVNVKIHQLKPKHDFNDDENNKKPSIYSINVSNIELSQDDVNINKDIDPNREKQIAAYAEIGLSTDKWKEDYSSYVERIHKVRSKPVQVGNG